MTFQTGLCARNLIIVNHLIIFLDAQEDDIKHPFVPEWGHKTNSDWRNVGRCDVQNIQVGP